MNCVELTQTATEECDDMYDYCFEGLGCGSVPDSCRLTTDSDSDELNDELLLFVKNYLVCTNFKVVMPALSKAKYKADKWLEWLNNQQKILSKINKVYPYLKDACERQTIRNFEIVNQQCKVR